MKYLIMYYDGKGMKEKKKKNDLIEYRLKNGYNTLIKMYKESLKVEDKYYGFQFQRLLSGGMSWDTTKWQEKEKNEQLNQIQLWWYLCLGYLKEKGYFEHLQLLFLINDSSGIIDDKEVENITLKNMGLSKWVQTIQSGRMNTDNDKWGNMGFIFGSLPECIGYRYWTFADYAVRAIGIPLNIRKTMVENCIKYGTYESSIHFFINRLLTVFPRDSSKLRSFIIKYGFRNKMNRTEVETINKTNQAKKEWDAGEDFIKEGMNELLKNKKSDIYKFKKFKNENLFNDKEMQLMYILHPITDDQTKEHGLLECDSLSCTIKRNDDVIQEQEKKINDLVKNNNRTPEENIELEMLKKKQGRDVSKMRGILDMKALEAREAVCQEMKNTKKMTTKRKTREKNQQKKFR